MTFVKHTFILLIVMLALLQSCFVLAQNQTVQVSPSSKVEKQGDAFYFMHPVKPGQTLYSISRAYSVTQESIINANPELEYGLKSDQVIKIPAFDYTVVAGDTEYGLSRRFELTIEQLKALNPSLSGGLKLGQQLFLPKKMPDEMAAGQIKTSISEADSLRLIVWPKQSGQQSDDARDSVKVQPLAPDSMLAIQSSLGVHGSLLPCAEASYSDVYHVALLIPLFLHEFPSDSPLDTLGLENQERLSLNHISFSFIPYYQGVLLALDSARKSGVDIRLHVFDVDRNEQKARETVSSPRFKDIDLIIGPFYNNTLDYISQFALHNNIPVVSPLLPDNQKLRGFPNLFNAVPSLEEQLSNLANYIGTQYTGGKIILVHNNQQQALPVINSFKTKLENSLRYSNRQAVPAISNDTLLYSGNQPDSYNPKIDSSRHVDEIIYDREGMDGLLSKMDKENKNIVITLIGGEAFLANYLRELDMHSDDYDLELFGIPEWKDYESIDIEYIQNLNVHIFTHNFTDYSEQHNLDFVRRYRSEFNAEPSSDAFKAVHTAYYFFTALALYGKTFPDCMDQLNRLLYDTNFQFTRPFGHDHGWENSHSVIFKYEDYQMVNVNKQ